MKSSLNRTTLAECNVTKATHSYATLLTRLADTADLCSKRLLT